MYTRHGAPLESIKLLVDANFDRQRVLMDAFVRSFDIKPLVTDEMVAAALQEHKYLLDNPLLDLPQLGKGSKGWDEAVMRRILEAAERVRLESKKE